MNRPKTPHDALPRTPHDVLKECGIKKPPVPVEKIAEHYDIQLCVLRGSNDICGAIVRSKEGVVIAINPAQHPNRQRFTIAHELGHYFCHPSEEEHVDRDFRISWRRAGGAKGVDWKEVQANRFAAGLLIPEEFLERDLNRISELDEPTINHLASRYKVSALAMKFRLQNLGLIRPDLASL
jgi:Zn-dependent peptidase ImmA (M78 family)